MKKKIVMLLTVTMICAGVTACGSTKGSSNAEGGSVAIADEETPQAEDADSTSITSGEGLSAADVSKPEDFDHILMQDGTIAVTGYNGEASVVIVPEEIKGAKVTSVRGINMNDAIVRIELPDSITRIEDEAFKANDNLEEVIIGPNVEYIGKYAFDRDKALKSINIPASVTEIGHEAFRMCAFEEVTIPDGITKLSKSVFALSFNLKNITIPGNVKTIEKQAFEGCESLESVVIEEGVESIGENVFADTDNLSRVEFPASVTQIDCKLNSNCTVVAPEGSYAETYAKERGYNFVAK